MAYRTTDGEKAMSEFAIEQHPLKPFLPANGKLLMLGSFPPPQARWSMPFFYPNFQNDMWRIMGLLFFNNKDHFVVPAEKRFQYETVVSFCRETGIGIFDTASAVRRLKANASDLYLEIAEPTDISNLLIQMPACQAIVTTGQKATEIMANTMQCALPAVSNHVSFPFGDRTIAFYRMPSSSRAYPLAIDKKAAAYRTMFEELKML